MPNLGKDIFIKTAQYTRHTPPYAVSRQLKLNLLVFSTIVLSFTVAADNNSLNLRLNWKFEAKKLKSFGVLLQRI